MVTDFDSSKDLLHYSVKFVSSLVLTMSYTQRRGGDLYRFDPLIWKIMTVAQSLMVDDQTNVSKAERSAQASDGKASITRVLSKI